MTASKYGYAEHGVQHQPPFTAMIKASRFHHCSIDIST